MNKQNTNCILKCKRRNIVSQEITASSVTRVITLQSYFGITTKVILFIIIDNYEKIFDYYLKDSSKPTIFNNLFVRTLTYNNNKVDHDFEIKLDSFKKQPDIYKASSLIATFGKQNNLNGAFDIYRRLVDHSSHKPHIGVFTALMNACMKCNQPKRVVALWNDMSRYSVQLDNFCFGTLINACAKTGDIITAKKLIDKIKKREFTFKINVIDYTQLIRTFNHGNNIGDAIEVLQLMKQQNVQPDAITYISLLSSCANMTALEQGRLIHNEIINSGIKLNIILETALLNMYSKCGSMNEAQSIFDNMESRDIITWNAMISGYRQNGDVKESIELFKKMQQEGIQPNHFTFTIALSSCADLADLSLGREIHSQIDKSGIEWTIEMRNSLLNMYLKCGSMNEAQSIFDNMESRDIITWNAMISGYRQNGDVKKSIELFETDATRRNTTKSFHIHHCSFIMC